MTCFRRLLPWVTIAFFSLLVLLSLSAGLTGADLDMRWGVFRRAVFVSGSAGLLGAACLQLIRVLDKRILSKIHHVEASEPELEVQFPHSQTKSVSIRPLLVPTAKRHRRWIALAVAITVAVIGIAYVGLVSVWRWTQWPATDTYYGMLGDAFTQGKTYLPIEPTPGLSNSQNPYEGWSAKGGIVNLSYYQGKYYMYWGPAPAMVLAILRIAGAPILGDDVVVFASISFIFLFSCLIVFRLEHAYFEGVPLWLMIAGVVIVGTIHPMLWFQSSPGILTAAIASGQAFLVGGVYFMVRALTDTNAGPGNYAAAGALWGMAMTSRLTTVAAVIVLVLGVMIHSLKRAGSMHRHRTEVVNLVSLMAPVVLILGLYGWYNAIRFDSPFETGWRYQFVGINPNDQIARGTHFNWRYLAPNAIHYFLTPIRPISSFPYLRAVYYEYPLFAGLLSRLGVPADYTVEDATGLVFAAPTLLFAMTFARKWLYDEIPRQTGNDPPLIKAAGWTSIDQGPLGALLLLSGLAGVVPIILFYYSTTRYEMDFVPLLAIVAVLGLWRFYEDTRPLPIQSRMATGTIILIVTAAPLVSFLLAVSGAGSNIDDLNPDLFSFLVNFLPHW